MFYRNTLCSFVLVVGAALAVSACSKDDPAAPGDTSPPADVDQYLTALPSWNQFSPPLADADEATGPSQEDSLEIDGVVNRCTTTPYSITRTPDRVVTLNPDVEILWLGALLQGKGHLGGIGSLGELPVRQRNPINISIDLLTADNTRAVKNPSLSTVNAAVGDLVETAQNAGNVSGSNIFYTREDTYSMTQAALAMGLSANYMGASIKASLSANISSETRTVTAYFVQRMFTVSMELPQTPGSVFSDAFTEQMLQDQIDHGRIGPDNPPVYLSSIAYGRILMFSFTSSASLEDIHATLEAVYNGGDFGGSLDGKLRDILNEASIQVVAVGGNADDALALIRSNNLGDYFTTDAPLTTARPISYTVRNLADNSIASVSETTNYNLEQCVPESVPLAGAVYTLRYTKVKVIDLPFIDVPYPYHYLDPLDIEMRWDAKVETPLGTSTATKFNVTVLNPYAKAMKEGETYNLPNNATTDLQIHFDGTDYIRLTGMIQDADVYPTSGADDLPFYREFRYPSKPINFTESYVDAKDSWGNTVRVFFTFQKTGDL